MPEYVLLTKHNLDTEPGVQGGHVPSEEFPSPGHTIAIGLKLYTVWGLKSCKVMIAFELFCLIKILFVEVNFENKQSECMFWMRIKQIGLSSRVYMLGRHPLPVSALLAHTLFSLLFIFFFTFFLIRFIFLHYFTVDLRKTSSQIFLFLVSWIRNVWGDFLTTSGALGIGFAYLFTGNKNN